MATLLPSPRHAEAFKGEWLGRLSQAGVLLHPGETVRYVITSAKDAVKDWRVRPLALMEGALEYDPAKYLELLDRAAKEILSGL